MTVRDLDDFSKTKPDIKRFKKRVRRGRRWVEKTFWRYCIPLYNKTGADIDACFTFYYLQNWGNRQTYEKICSGRVTVSKKIVKPLGEISGCAQACCETNFSPPDGATVVCMVGDWTSTTRPDVDWRTGVASGRVAFKNPKKRKTSAGRAGRFGARLGWRLAAAKTVKLAANWEAPLGWELDFEEKALSKSFPTVIRYTVTPPADARLGEYANLELMLIGEGEDGPLEESEFAQFVVTESTYVDDTFDEDVADPSFFDEYEEEDGGDLEDGEDGDDVLRVAADLRIIDD